MSEGFTKSLIKKYATKEAFDKETVLEDLDFDVVDYSKFTKTVFENNDYKICQATEPEGMIDLCSGTRWLSGNNYWNSDRKSGYDEVDTNSSYGPWAQYKDYYIILDKHDPKKKWMFKKGYGDIYVPSYTRYACATWVAEHGDESMWKWFLDQKFPYISTNLDKKVGAKILKDKDTFIYPDDAAKLTWYNKKGSNITKVEFVPGTKVIKANAFSGLQNIKEIIVPEGVTTINNRAFYNCGVETIVLPSTVKTIGAEAFGYCANLKNINLPEGLTKLGKGAFYYTPSLKKMPEWPKNITTIPEYCFSNSGLQEINIPNHVSKIGHYAFSGVPAKKVIIPNSVTSIDYMAFDGRQLLYIYIPSSVTTIDEFAFGKLHSWDKPIEEPNLVIDCEATEKPEGWNNDWCAYYKELKDRYRHDYHYDYNNPDGYDYKYYKVNWGVKSPRVDINEDLEIDSNIGIPGLLNDEQCEKLLDLIISLPEMAKKDKKQWDFITTKWLLNIWMINNGPNMRKVDSYINSLSNPTCKHVIMKWAKNPSTGDWNYNIWRITEEGLQFMVGGDYDYNSRIDKYNDICVSTAFVKEFLGVDINNVSDIWHECLEEDLEITTADGFAADYKDDHWIVYHPNNAEEFMIMADGTTWYEGRNHDDYTDWRLRSDYYKSIPYYVFENRDTGDKWLYNTRDNYDALEDANGDRWRSKQTNKYYLGSTRTAGNILSLFLSEMPNTEGVSKWAIRKWPQGLKELKAIITANQLLKEAGDVVIYKSELYNKIHNTFWWVRGDKPYMVIKDRAEKIAFPRNTQTIEDNAFRDFKGIKEIIIPNTVKIIGDFAFGWCSSVEKITLPKNIKSIGSSAFNGCKKVSGSLFIPASCTEIGEFAFKYCSYETIYCEAPSKPEGWDDDWDAYKEEYITVDGKSTHRYKKFNVVWGSKGPVQEDLELDNISTEIDIPEDKKREAALLLGISPAEKRWNMRWWMDLEPYEETSRIVVTPYRVHIGDKLYFITANLANRLLKQLDIDYEVSEPEFN